MDKPDRNTHTRLAAIGGALAAYGLTLRGGFAVTALDSVPAAQNGKPTRSILMIGNIGGEMWRHFCAERKEGANPLDAWCEARLTEIGMRFGARAIFPFQKPYQPFQRWLTRAEPCAFSPLGLIVHPQYGLWHAIRGAFLFADRLAMDPPANVANPCETCVARPCLHACPVAAFSGNGYDVPRCIDWLKRPEGNPCLQNGCLARHACPVGQAYRYQPGQAAFHMAAFLRSCGGA